MRNVACLLALCLVVGLPGEVRGQDPPPSPESAERQARAAESEMETFWLLSTGGTLVATGGLASLAAPGKTSGIVSLVGGLLDAAIVVGAMVHYDVGPSMEMAPVFILPLGAMIAGAARLALAGNAPCDTHALLGGQPRPLASGPGAAGKEGGMIWGVTEQSIRCPRARLRLDPPEEPPLVALPPQTVLRVTSTRNGDDVLVVLLDRRRGWLPLRCLAGQ